MSTRAVYGFKDARATFWVYVHHDGYPTGAADKFDAVLKSKLVWPLARFEADEFGAGFIAANKDSAGSVRLTTGPEAHSDTEYSYLVEDRAGVLHLTAYSDGTPSKEAEFYSGTVMQFIHNAHKIEEALNQTMHPNP